jgi:hypothetical protein
MERTAARIAIFPTRPLKPSTAGMRVTTRDTRSIEHGCTIHMLRRGWDPRRQIGEKRIAVLDPFEIERRLLVALAQAQGHHVAALRNLDEFLSSCAECAPQIAFVHICFEPELRQAAGPYLLPPIVLIDPYSIGSCAQTQLTPVGDFTALRFPIGLHEFNEAIRRNAC